MQFWNHYWQYFNSQYFWINLRDFKVETESKWLNIFNKQVNKSTLKHRRELTPNIKFQVDRMFIKSDLFEQVIKSYKATNKEFLMFKEKLGICFFGELTEEIFEVSNVKSTKDLIEESDNESNKILIKELVKKLDGFSDEESSYEFFEESDNESIEESTKKLIKESDKKSNKESTKKLTKELIKESTKKSSKESVNKSNKNSIERFKKYLKKRRRIY